MTKLSSAIRNSEDNRWIAEKLNNSLRLRGDFEGVTEAEVVEAMGDMTYEEKRRPLRHNLKCKTCDTGGMKPPHYGSKRCESGSIASGGQHAHCSCSVCF